MVPQQPPRVPGHVLRAALGALILAACGGDEPPDCDVAAGTGPAMPATGLCKRLSTYRLFTDVARQAADPALVPYDLATPLFSDYADKRRWLYLPPGGVAAWRDVDALELPIGAMLVKTCAYADDRRSPAAGQRLLETRLLFRQLGGWKAAAYVYREDGTDADLAVDGDAIDAAWVHDDGAPRTNRYLVPDTNQCLNCHGEHAARMAPLGPKVRHLNRPTIDGAANQLQRLIDAGLLTGAPDPSTWPRDPALDDPTAPLAARARAWLDVHCAHCHNGTGAARTVGLDFSSAQTNPEALGVCKLPVAGGAATGGRRYDVVPGQPDQSILVFRLESTDPELRMPSLGRNLVDAEGLALIRAWIAGLPGGCP